jgi:two-component sensor histidine kinase
LWRLNRRGMQPRIGQINRECRANPYAAQAIAIALHELATNAAKYGALSVADGQVDLKWSHEPNGELHLRWMERGGPAVQEPARKGFGRRIIERLIFEQKGKLRFDWRAKGLVCEITLHAAVLGLRDQMDNLMKAHS